MRRICLAAIAIAACSLTAATMVATAGAKTKSSKAKAKVTMLKSACKGNDALAPPSGSDQVVPPVSQGQAYGGIDCTGLGSGVQSVAMTDEDSGDITGVWWDYLKAGSLHGTYVLTPGASLPTNPQNFAAGTYTGTVTVIGGTGVLKGVTGAGTESCNTQDSVHYSCTEHLKVKLPPVTTTKSKKN